LNSGKLQNHKISPAVDHGTVSTPIESPSGHPKCRTFAEYLQNGLSEENDEAGGIPPDLAQVIDAWGRLPNVIKKGVLALVTASEGSVPSKK
jgi:hypothetical protein